MTTIDRAANRVESLAREATRLANRDTKSARRRYREVYRLLQQARQLVLRLSREG